jgi:hypothetical protein
MQRRKIYITTRYKLISPIQSTDLAYMISMFSNINEVAHTPVNSTVLKSEAALTRDRLDNRKPIDSFWLKGPITGLRVS